MIGVEHRVATLRNHATEHPLSLEQWEAPKILSVQREQVEGNERWRRTREQQLDRRST
jgi:hypothetical protein